MVLSLALLSVIVTANKEVPIHDLIVSSASTGANPTITGTFRLGLHKDAGADWYASATRQAVIYVAPPKIDFDPAWNWTPVTPNPSYFTSIKNESDSDADIPHGRDVGEGSEIGFTIPVPDASLAKSGCLYIAIDSTGYYGDKQASFVEVLYALRVTTGNPQFKNAFIAGLDASVSQTNGKHTSKTRSRKSRTKKTDTVVPIDIVRPFAVAAKNTYKVHTFKDHVVTLRGFYVAPGKPADLGAKTSGSPNWNEIKPLEQDGAGGKDHYVMIDPATVGHFIITSHAMTSSLLGGVKDYHDETSGILRTP